MGTAGLEVASAREEPLRITDGGNRERWFQQEIGTWRTIAGSTMKMAVGASRSMWTASCTGLEPSFIRTARKIGNAGTHTVAKKVINERGTRPDSSSKRCGFI